MSKKMQISYHCDNLYNFYKTVYFNRSMKEPIAMIDLLSATYAIKSSIEKNQCKNINGGNTASFISNPGLSIRQQSLR